MALTVRQEDYWLGRIKSNIRSKKVQVLIDNNRPDYEAERAEEGRQLAIEQLGIANEISQLGRLQLELEELNARKNDLEESQKEAVVIIAEALPEPYSFGVGYKAHRYWEAELAKYGAHLSKSLPDDDISLELKEVDELNQRLVDGIMAATSPTRLVNFLQPEMLEHFGVEIG